MSHWAACFKYVFLEPFKQNNSWLLILFSAYAYNYCPAKYQKLLVNADPGSTSACNVFWRMHNCCDAVVCIKLAKATRKTPSFALILYWPGIIYKHMWSEAFLPHLKDLTWRGFPTQHSTDMRPNWGLRIAQNKTRILRQGLNLHVMYQFVWSDEEDLWWCVHIGTCESIGSQWL